MRNAWLCDSCHRLTAGARARCNADGRATVKTTYQGYGQVVATLGEAGAGKSRLFYEFKAVAQSECTVLETFSLSYGKSSAYLPVIDLLRNYFGIAIEELTILIECCEAEELENQVKYVPI